MRRFVFSASLLARRSLIAGASLGVVGCLCGLSVVSDAQRTDVFAQGRGPLGKISFPNSGAQAAQADFIRGVLWLHSFGYEEAIDAFRAAQKIDPGFAMAYWGEAMSFNQPLWFHEDVAAAQAALAKLGATPQARAAKAKTAREQAYLTAVDALFAAGATKAARDASYAERMAALAKQFPADDEAKVFHALAILAMLPRGDQSLPLRKQAGAIAEGVFARNPQHPGAPHYILHAYDHAALAAGALPAARAYAKIAPAASHALHMPSHAFLQLGYWDEAAASDQASWDASIAWAAGRKLSVAMRDFHSLTWLHYEWTQQGRFAKAAEAIGLIDEAMKAVGTGGTIGGHHYADSEIGRGSGPATLRNDRGSLRARFVVESERWTEMKGQPSFDNVDELFALAMSAYKLGDRGRLIAAVGEFEKMSSGPDAALREQASVMLHEAGALLLFADGQTREAFAAMDRAVAAQARLPKPIGRPYPVKGADELYGELLLQNGRAADAVGWFERALARTPNRSRAVIGLARATAKAGLAARSRAAYQKFLVNWRLADAGLPELAEVRAALKN
jgi:tetratricopeptide (TPR) repeat protein